MSERGDVGSQPAETPDPGGGNRGNVNNRNGNGRNNNNGNNNNNRRKQDHEGRMEALKGYMFRIRAQHPWESFARTCPWWEYLAAIGQTSGTNWYCRP